MNEIKARYDALMALYGPQGWWPLGKGVRYHPRDYSIPAAHAKDSVFEVYLGAVLTQNGSWTGACASLLALAALSALRPRALLKLPQEILEDAIRPARYFRQKARYLCALAEFFLALKGRIPSRQELLAVLGVGRETADSILLYAHHQPFFVVDAYTRRVFSAWGFISGKEDYDAIREMFESSLPKDAAIFNEYHALIVRHARAHYSRKPYGVDDPLAERNASFLPQVKKKFHYY